MLHSGQNYDTGIYKASYLSPFAELANMKRIWNKIRYLEDCADSEEYIGTPWCDFVDRVEQFFQAHDTKITDQSFRCFSAFCSHYVLVGGYTKAEKRERKRKEKEQTERMITQKQEEEQRWKEQEAKEEEEQKELDDLWKKYPVRYPTPLNPLHFRYGNYVTKSFSREMIRKSNIYLYE